MKKLYFINNWDQTTESHIEDMKYATPYHHGIWKNEITYTLNFSEADYFIIFEGIPIKYRDQVDYQRAIYVQLEPPWLTQKNDFIVQQNLIYRVMYETMFGVAMWWSYVPFIDFVELDSWSKPKKLSCLMSNKKMEEGHRLRLKFLKEYLKKYDNIDIFGWNLESENLGNCFKGTLPRTNTADAYNNYAYSFVCENGSYPNYATARLFDCVLNWSIPIYWGCSNLENYFPKESFYTINVLEDSVDKLYDISQRLITEKNLKALKEARALTLYEYNIWEILYKIIKGRI
jgi:hypothetical protein